jgi:ribosomal protein S18 acetylase RimI-like enzyme
MAEVTSLLALCMWQDDDRIQNELSAYQAEPSRCLMGMMKDGELVGLIGIESIAVDAAIVKHIAVKPSYRNQNVARGMIEAVMKDQSLKYLEAETDDEAVGFYERMGFRIESLGEKYPGVVRYRCVLSKSCTNSDRH